MEFRLNTNKRVKVPSSSISYSCQNAKLEHDSETILRADTCREHKLIRKSPVRMQIKNRQGLNKHRRMKLLHLPIIYEVNLFRRPVAGAVTRGFM